MAANGWLRPQRRQGRGTQETPPRKPAREELNGILDAHAKWLESKGCLAGGRADLSRLDLSEENLEGANLQKADLQGADLANANLRKANLSGANVEDAHFCDAVLSGADLTDVTGLLPGRLAGADLRGATVPDSVLKFEAKAQVERLSTNTGQLFLAMLAGCAFAWVTIYSTRDAQLLNNALSSPLPFIGQALPTAAFYWLWPLLLSGLFLYFHLYLQRLWEALALQPAYLQDGTPLDQATYPWLMNGLVRAYVPLLSGERLPRFPLQKLITVIAGWCLAPITLLLFWGRYLCQHQPWISWLHVTLLAASILVAGTSFLLARSALSRDPVSRRSRVGIYLAAGCLGILLAWLSAFVINLARQDVQWPWTYNKDHSRVDWLRRKLLRDLHPFLELTDPADVAQKPASWKEDYSEIINVPVVDLSGRDLRFMRARHAFMPRVVLSEADCRGADFAGANLWGANLTHAKLNRADLHYAKLKGAQGERADLSSADLRYADLALLHAERADFGSANLRHANLQGADLEFANLQGAHLEDANLQGADLEFANLQGARLEGANLRGAYLGYANLQRAHLEGAKLPGAHLGDANLQGADLTRANLKGADLEDAKLPGADLPGANLQRAQLGGANLQRAQLGFADLQGADLDHANLRGAGLEGANLQGAHLDNAKLQGAYLHFTNLQGARYSPKTVPPYPHFNWKAFGAAPVESYWH